MKRHPFRTGIWAAIVIPLLMSSVPVAHAGQCSPAGVAGKFGFTLNGVVLLPTGAVPIAAIGRATVDAKGNVTGTESRSVGGDYADETLQGTITVNPECTGSMTVSFFEAGQLVRTSVLSIVFDGNQREIRMVQKSLQLPDGSFLPVVITVDGKKIFAEDED
jgi:hypothetical protein